MVCEIIFTAKAKQNLNDVAIEVYELSKDKPTAVRFVNRLRGAVDRLKNFPLSGKLPVDRTLLSFGYRYLIEGDYLIFYVYDDESHKAYIHYIVNGKTDYIRAIIGNI